VNRIVPIIVIVAALATPAVAQQPPPATIKACQLLPKAEIKSLIGAGPLFDRLPVEEEPLGNYGSACEYPEIRIQVMRFTPATIENARRSGALETVNGIGDEAYFHANGTSYAELYVKVGAVLLTLQRSVPPGQTVTGVRGGVLALATALVPKLR